MTVFTLDREIIKANGTLFWFVFQLENYWRNWHAVKKKLHFFESNKMLINISRVGVRRIGPNSFQWCPATGQGAMGTN